MPSTAVYLEARPSLMARIAASLMCSGVSKSGSPAPRPMTLRPAAFNWRALSVTAMVGDGLMRLRWSARKAIGSSEVPVETRVFGGRFGPIMRRRQVARTDRSINAVDGPSGDVRTWAPDHGLPRHRAQMAGRPYRIDRRQVSGARHVCPPTQPES